MGNQHPRPAQHPQQSASSSECLSRGLPHPSYFNQWNGPGLGRHSLWTNGRPAGIDGSHRRGRGSFPLGGPAPRWHRRLLGRQQQPAIGGAARTFRSGGHRRRRSPYRGPEIGWICGLLGIQRPETGCNSRQPSSHRPDCRRRLPHPRPVPGGSHSGLG